jgi:hypothetical protein
MTHRRSLIYAVLLLAMTILNKTHRINRSGNIPVAGDSVPYASLYNPPLVHSFAMTEFVGKVKNGNHHQLVGVYIPGIMALPVRQQPEGNPTFVSTQPDMLTQFGLAGQYGSTGILAHNTLSGAHFYKIKPNTPIYLIYGDGRSETFQVTSIERFQALSPSDPYSDFVDLTQPSSTDSLSSSELFYRVYKSAQEQVVFQTCISGEGNPSWGRMFITATRELDKTANTAVSRFTRVLH